MVKPISAGERFDDISRRRLNSGLNLELLEQSRDISDLARDIAFRGSFKAYLEDVRLEDDPYEYVGTYFVPLDDSRSIAVRELPRENRGDEVKVGLKIMTGGKNYPTKPRLIATFSAENDSVELTGYDGVTAEDLKDLEALLEHISNSPEK